MNFSTCPAVVDYLLTLATGAAFPSSVVIADANWDSDNLPDEMFVVNGHANNTSGDIVTAGTRQIGRISKPVEPDEQYTIPCSIRSWNGDPAAQKAARDRVWAMFNVIDEALRRDPTCAGIVPQQAWVSQWTLSEGDPDVDGGSVALLTFDVTVETLLTS